MLLDAGDASPAGASARDTSALHVVHVAAEMAPIAKVKPAPAVCALYKETPKMSMVTSTLLDSSRDCLSAHISAGHATDRCKSDAACARAGGGPGRCGDRASESLH